MQQNFFNETLVTVSCPTLFHIKSGKYFPPRLQHDEVNPTGRSHMFSHAFSQNQSHL